MADKVQTIFTKIVLRNDVLSAWQASTIVLEKGEPAVEINLTTKVAKMKIGDGTSTFNDLPYMSLTPDEVQEKIDAAIAGLGGSTSGGTGAVNSVSLEPGTNNGTLKLIVNGVAYDNIAVTGLGSAAFTDASDYATAAQGERAEKSMAFKGVIDTVPTLGIVIGDTYKVTTDLVINAAVSATGADVNVYAGDVITVTADGKWELVMSSVAETAKSLTTGISANLTGAVTGSTSVAANAGETMEIEVKSINFDYVEQGSNVIIFNGGSATN